MPSSSSAASSLFEVHEKVAPDSKFEYKGQNSKFVHHSIDSEQT